MKLIRKLWPFIFIFGVWFVLFKPFFTKGLLPIPADIITGVYYPWLDYKWGYSVGVPVKNPLISDIPSLLYPWRSFAVDEMKAGRWPLWNPYYFAGMPLIANFQSAVFSYVNLFFLFFAKPIAWSFGVMTSPLLTMLVMYLFLRHKELAKTSALLGAVVFSLSGFEIAWLEYNVHGHTVLFLPLLLFLIDKIYEGKRKVWLLLLPIFVACQIFTGYLPVVIYTYLICLLYVGYFYLLPGLRKGNLSLKRHALLGLFWTWGILLAGVQLLPGWELAKNSIRLTDPTVEASNASYLPVANLVTLLAPDFFGNPATGNYFGKAFYDNFYLFAGTGTLIFIFYALFFFRKNKNIGFWFFVLLFSFILVLKNPLGLILERLLFLSGGVASKALFITDFSLAVLASLGMESFLQADQKSKRRILSPIILLLLFFIFSALFSFRLNIRVNQLVAQRNLIIPFVSFLLVSVILTVNLIREKLFNSKTKITSFTAFLFIVVVSAQLLYSAKKYLPFSKKELLFPKTPVIDFLLDQKNKNPEPFRVELGEVIPQNFLMPYGLESTSGYDALLPKKTGQFFSILETGKIDEKISRVWLIRNYDSNLFPLLNTEYILAKKMDKYGKFSPAGKPPDIFKDSRFNLVFEDKTVQVYEDKKSLSRAFWVHDIIIASSSADFADLSSLRMNFFQRVVLEKKLDFVAPKIKSKIDKIEWIKYQPDKIDLVVESDQPGLVFLADSFFPGWEGFIDSRPTEILRANFAFRAIFVDEGRHLVTFEYRPKIFLYGSLLSSLALANWFLFLSLCSIRKIWEKRS